MDGEKNEEFDGTNHKVISLYIECDKGGMEDDFAPIEQS